jgi:hypothetical protein
MSNKSELKVDDWVRLKVIGLNDEKYEPPYQIESIDGDNYVVVQKEGSYAHRMTLKKEKLKKV